MRVFRYAPEVYGEGGVRLGGDDITIVDRPADADVLVVPRDAYGLSKAPHLWERLWNEPEIQRRPECTLIYDCAEWFQPLPVAGCIYIRAALTRQLLEVYPTAVSWPWPVPDLGWYAEAHHGHRPKHAVGFVGWRSPLRLTELAVRSVQNHFGIRANCVVHRDFHGHRGKGAGLHREGQPPEDPETAEREEQYRAIMLDSLTTLTPQSILGVPRYRFYEAMTMWRVPVEVGSDAVRPWADTIPWDELSFTVAPEDVGRTGELLNEWLADRGVERVLDLGAECRLWYDRLLDKRHWPRLMATVVRERLGC